MRIINSFDKSNNLIFTEQHTMNDFFNFLFHYLEKEEILLDKPEFLFQVQSHPNYPSLLAISDTLSFFILTMQLYELSLPKLTICQIGLLHF